uniref:Uncharacterized protein n=1 Tax=Anopheles melas TaxID=34690 RepID=A0A182UFS3_9DIPT
MPLLAAPKHHTDGPPSFPPARLGGGARFDHTSSVSRFTHILLPVLQSASESQNARTLDVYSGDQSDLMESPPESILATPIAARRRQPPLSSRLAELNEELRTESAAMMMNNFTVDGQDFTSVREGKRVATPLSEPATPRTPCSIVVLVVLIRIATTITTRLATESATATSYYYYYFYHY